jgi:hypothetical protein
LDTIYNKLLRIKNEIDPHPQDSINDFIYNEVLNFADEKNYNLTYIESIEYDSFDNLTEYLNSNPNLSEYALNMLSDLDSVFNEYVEENISLLQFNQYCDSKIPVAYSLDSLIEKYIVGSTLMVAKYTTNYWTSNYDDWVELGNLDETIKISINKNKSNSSIIKLLDLSPTAKNVMAKDIGGAFGGGSSALGFLITNPEVSVLVGPGGIASITLGMAMVGAGVNSVKAAIGVAAGGLPWWLDW